jgi:hypothetical protein
MYYTRACLKNDKTHKEADLFPQFCVIFSRNTPSMPSKNALSCEKISRFCAFCYLLYKPRYYKQDPELLLTQRLPLRVAARLQTFFAQKNSARSDAVSN